MESGYLPDSALSASTTFSGRYIPQFSRLNKIPASGNAGAWCPGTNDGNQWLQIYFGQETTVTKVATQDRYDCCDQWVMSYSLSYNVDGSHWAWYRLSDGQLKVTSVGLHDCFLFLLLFMMLLLLLMMMMMMMIVLLLPLTFLLLSF